MSEKGSVLWQLTLVALSVYVLVALIVDLFVLADPEVRRAVQYVDFAVCLIFLADFFVNLYLANNRLKYMKWGWIDLISSIPMVDPLRWGRVARLVRILRFLRAIRSIRILYGVLVRDRIESLTILVFIFTFISYTLSACWVLDFERAHGGGEGLQTAESALWWAFMNILNAKTSITQAATSEAAIAAIYLNKVGLVVFAYFNAILIAWLMRQRTDKLAPADGITTSDS